MKQVFEAQIHKSHFTYVDIPFDTEEVFGVKYYAKVQGLINHIPFQNTLMPKTEGVQYLVVGNKICKALGIGVGDFVQVEMELNLNPPLYEIPDYFQEALDEIPEAKAVFDKYSAANKRQFVKYILQPKSETARWNRIEKLLTRFVVKGK
jgi:Bacteriocin-protection, YdeI or OmpD-Associated/Domain of unknown function (DUF1905)